MLARFPTLRFRRPGRDKIQHPLRPQSRLNNHSSKTHHLGCTACPWHEQVPTSFGPTVTVSASHWNRGTGSHLRGIGSDRRLSERGQRWGAATICGTTHRTVRRILAARDRDPAERHGHGQRLGHRPPNRSRQHQDNGKGHREDSRPVWTEGARTMDAILARIHR